MIDGPENPARPGTPAWHALGQATWARGRGVVLLDRGVVLRRTAKGEWVFPKGDGEKLPLWRYHKGKNALLFPPEEALERVTFPDTREVLKKVLARLNRFYFPAGRRGPLEDGV